MKQKLLSVLATAVLVFGFYASCANAQQQTATFTVTVVCMGTVGITVSPDSISLGTVMAGGSTRSAEAVTVSIYGSALVDLSLAQKGTTTAWEIDPDHGTPTGTNKYILAALFNSTQPNMGSFTIGGTGATGDSYFDVIGTVFIEASDTTDGVYTGDQTGSKIEPLPNTTRNLWVAFWAPTITSSTQQQSIEVYIRAEPH